MEDKLLELVINDDPYGPKGLSIMVKENPLEIEVQRIMVGWNEKLVMKDELLQVVIQDNLSGIKRLSITAEGHRIKESWFVRIKNWINQKFNEINKRISNS